MKKHQRELLWRVIFKADTRAGKQFDILLLIAILISILAVILESVESLNAEFHKLFKVAEMIITGVFTLEYILRIIVVRSKQQYIFSFYGIVDLLAILPFYIGLIFVGSQSLMVIRVIRLIRIFRILKLSRYTKAANTIMLAIRGSLVKISVFLFGVMIMVLIIGAAMYLIEGKEHGFKNIPTSIYWAIVTLTTVGYGDIAPQTAFGQFIASIVMIMGYGIIAVPTGIITAQVISEQKGSVRSDCNNCGKKNHAPDAKFCQNCGQSLNSDQT
ncbi:MAG: ion transporter [Bacteroidota bacterium]|nr:ion transporter [Bacteroidota bacterium]